MRFSRLALIVAAAYLAVSILWIVFSDTMVERFTTDPDLINTLQTWKGLAFVTGSALVIFAFIWWYDLRRMEQEKRLDTVFNSVSDAFAVLDHDWRVLYSNPKADQFSGKDQPIVGMNVWDAFPEMLGTEFEKAYRKAMHERVETRAVDLLPGYDVWFEARGVPVPEGLAIFGRDITAERTAELARERMERRFNRFLDHNPMAAWITDDRGVVLWASRGFRSELREPSDPVGRSLEELFGVPGRDALWDRIDSVREQGTPLVSAERLRRPDGEWRPFLVHRFVVDESPVSFGFVAIDITDRVDADGPEDSGTPELQEEIDALIHAVSHDLRAPLRGLTGFSDALMEDYGGRLDHDGQRYLNHLHDAAVTMNRLVDGLLELSRIGRKPVVREDVDLVDLVQAQARRLAEKSPERQVEIVVPEVLVVHADLALTRQAIGHLVDNAWKFTAPRKGARVALSVESGEFGRVVVLSDNGVGFDMTHAGRLFTPFQRLHGAGEFDGVGIGLAVVQRIVRRHGGRVWIDARQGEGTSVRFTLGGR